jgi:uncharacterized ion transporter superfamily protein YfcC
MKKKIKIPSSYTIIFLINLILIFISWIPNVAETKIGLFDLFMLPINGFKEKIDIIIFLLVLGGFLNIIIQSKALDASIIGVLKKLKGKEIWFIPAIMLIFSILGTTMGLGEETIALYPILIPVFLAAGFDIMTSIYIILFGAGIGVIASIINPFSIFIGFDNAISETEEKLNITQGIVWRFVSWVILTTFVILYVVWYALKVKKNENYSLFVKEKNFYKENFSFSKEEIKLTNKRKLICFVFLLTFIFMIVSLCGKNLFHLPLLSLTKNKVGKWGMKEISFLFFISSFICGLIDWDNEKKYIDNFIKGSSDMISVCLIISLAASIRIILKETKIDQKLIEKLKTYTPENNFLKLFTFFHFFLFLSFLIPSSSGFMTVTFKILNYKFFGSLISGMILASSFGNGIINLISPTSYILMASLSVSKVSYEKYIKSTWKFLLLISILSFLLLIIGCCFLTKGIF